jgi:GAF domain-containing protein
MSVATHLKMISTFDRWSYGQEPISALLQEALTYIKMEVKEALSLRLYHLNETGVLLGASTTSPRDSQIFITVSDHSAHTNALAHRQPLFDPRRATWLAPLESDNTTFGLLEISVGAHAEETDHKRDWIMLVAAQVSLALDTRMLQVLSHKQVQTSGELTRAVNYRETGGILAKYLLSENQFLSINLFVYDSKGEFNGFRTIVTANRHDVYEDEVRLEAITLEEIGLPLNRVVAEARSFLVTEISGSPSMSTRLKQWLGSFNITGVAAFPMRSQGKTFGFIAVNCTSGALYLAEAEMTVYQSLVDQVSTLVQLGRVSEEADFTQAISERQKLAFNELVAGQDFADMAGIIARHMLPDGGRYLIICDLMYDANGALIGWKPLASANRKQRYRSDEVDAPVTLLELASPALLSIRDGEIFSVEVKDDIEAKVGKSLANLLVSQGLRHYLSLPILRNDRPVALLIVVSRNERPFSREEINAFSNITEQMGALIQVRSLFEQAKNARKLVDQLVLANRLVTVASTTGYMAQSASYTLASEMKGTAITLFDQPLNDGGLPRFRRLIGLSVAEEVLTLDEDIRLNTPADTPSLNRLRAGQPVISESPTAYGGVEAKWVASFGLRSGDQLLGTLDILNDVPYMFTSEEIDSYSTLADQIGITLRSHQLIDEAETAQEVASQLVQTNLQISTAQNYDEMAQAIIQNLPDSILSAVILLFDQPLRTGEVPQWFKLEVFATRDGVEHPEIVDIVAREEDATTSQGLQAILSGDLITVEDSRNFPFKLIFNTIEYLNGRGMYSFIAAGLRTGTRFVGLMALGAEDFAAMGELQRENLRAIASQVAVAVENRILVNQTADALSFVGLQYEISNIIHRTQDTAKQLAAVFRLVEQYYTHARLGVIEPDSHSVRIIAQVGADGTSQSVKRDSGVLYSTPITPETLEKQEVIVSEDGRTLTFPLLSTTSFLYGAVQFLNDHDAVILSQEELRALQNLIDQLSIAFQNNWLLRQMEEGLEETRTLYEANRALLNANTPAQAIHVLYNIIARDADFVSLLSMGYDITGKLHSCRLEAIVGGEGAPVLQKPLELPFVTTWEKADTIEFAETEGEIVLLRSMLAFYESLDIEVESSIAMPIFEEGVLSQLINVVFGETRKFENTTRRLYAAVRDQLAIVLQNQRLIEDTRSSATRLSSQVRVLQTLNNFALNLSTLREEKALLEGASQAFHQALGLDHVGITLLNTDSLSATVVADYPAQNLVGLQVEDRDDLQQQIRQSRDVIYLPDVATAEGLAKASREALLRIGVQTLLLVPILDNNDQYLGSAGLEFKQKGRVFTADMIEIARTIAAQVAIGLQNIREVQKTQRQADQLQRLANFSQSLQSQLDLPSILNTLAVEAPNILKLDHLSVMLYDNTTNTLRLALQYNNGALYRVTTSTSVVIEGTTAGRAWKVREMVSIPHLRRERDLVHTFNSQMLSVTALPLFVRGAAIGVIEISSLTPYAYNDTDLIVFRQLVSQVGVAVENAETYTQSQRLARSKALVNEISSQIQKQGDLDSILNVTVNELGRALGAKQARVRLGDNPDNGEKSEQW